MLCVLCFGFCVEFVGVDDDALMLAFADEIGVQDYYWQDGPAALESFIPAFDLTGV